MSWFPMVAAVDAASRAFPDRFEALRSSVLSDYAAYGIEPSGQLEIECLFFICWSVEIGLLNSRSGWFDRWRSARSFAASVNRCQSLAGAGDIRIAKSINELYRDRFRDVLRTIRNVYVTSDRIGSLKLPFTTRSTRLFLDYTTLNGADAPVELRERLHGTLIKRCGDYIFDIMSKSNGPILG